MYLFTDNVFDLMKNFSNEKKFVSFTKKKRYNNIQNIWRYIMDICYNKLFKLVIDKGLRKMEFAKNAGISQNTMAKLSKNQYVSMKVLVKICKNLNCTLDDIVEIL